MSFLLLLLWALLIEGLCFEENVREWRKRWATWGQYHRWHEAPSPPLSSQLSLNILIQKGKWIPGKGVSRPSYPSPFCASKLESVSGFLPRLLISQGATLLLLDEEWSFSFGEFIKPGLICTVSLWQIPQSLGHEPYLPSFIRMYMALLSLSCGMWDLVLWPGIEPGPPALGVWSLSHWITREVPYLPRFNAD